MTKNEMKKFFFQCWNECYLATNDKYPTSIFHVHDEQYIREMKLKRVLKNQESIEIDINNGEIYFEEDYKHNALWMNYNKIWRFLENDRCDIGNMISKWLKKDIEYIGKASFHIESGNPQRVNCRIKSTEFKLLNPSYCTSDNIDWEVKIKKLKPQMNFSKNLTFTFPCDKWEDNL